MKRLMFLVCSVLLMGGFGLVALAEGDHKASDEGKQTTIQGELIDTACFVTSDGDAKGKDHAECGSKCLASGVPAGILPAGSKDSDAMMFLLTNPQPLAPYVGQTIRVEGKAYAHKHAIDAQKLYLLQGNAWKQIELKDEHHKEAAGQGAAASATYVCPMHPEVTSTQPAKCPKCGMNLVEKKAAPASHSSPPPTHGSVPANLPSHSH